MSEAQLRPGQHGGKPEPHRVPSVPLQVQTPLMQVVPAAQQTGSTPDARPQRAFTSPWHCAHRPVPWAASAKHWPRSGPGGREVQRSTQVEALTALDRDREEESGTPLPQAARTNAASAPTRHRFMVAPGTGSKCN
jgi:hypothetical protein